MNKKRIDKKVFDVHRTLPQNIDLKNQKPTTFKQPRPLWKRLALWLLLSATFFLVFVGIWDAINISRASSQMFGSSSLLGYVLPDELKQESGRVNVLIVGYSVDDPGHPGADLTDSILLLSMDQGKNSGFMLSVPRDLYVKIPGHGYGKINEAYKYGGMDGLNAIIKNNFGMPVHYYSLVNYGAVRDIVNALGGIDINIESSDPRGLYDPNISPADGGPLKLPNGPQRLDGKTALNLTRARGSTFGSYGFAQSDFDRTKNQQLVLAAIKNEISWTLILNPLKNGKIFQAIATNIKTNVSAAEARPLFGLFNRIPKDKLKSISLRELNGKNYLTSYSANGAGSALIPAAGLENYAAIKEALFSIE